MGVALQIEFLQSWRANTESGYKAWYGFVVLTADDVITFVARGKHGEPALSASAERPSAKSSAYVDNLIHGGKAKKIRRFPRSQIATISSVPEAQRLAIGTIDGEQHLIKQFHFPDEVERVAERLAVALFVRAVGQGSHVSATGSGMNGPTLMPLGASVLIGGGLIMLALLGGQDVGGRGRWILETVASIPLAAAITLGVIIMLIGVAFSFYRLRTGYEVTEWRLDDESLSRGTSGTSNDLLS